jgi:hypothetical protein
MRRAAALGLLALLLIAGCAAPDPRQSPNVQSETGHVDSGGGGGGGGSM